MSFESEAVGTLLRGVRGVVEDKETMLLDPDCGGLPGLKSEPIPAPWPYCSLRPELGERDGRLSGRCADCCCTCEGERGAAAGDCARRASSGGGVLARWSRLSCGRELSLSRDLSLGGPLLA